MVTIVLHELKKMIKSTTFYFLVALSIVLFALNGVTFTKMLSSRLETYNTSREQCDGKLHRLSIYVATPPVMTSFIAEGGEKKRALVYDVNLNNGVIPYPMETNTKLSFIPVFDWIFIVKIIFSIYVLLLVYNAISGEREAGTLRLVLSNPLQRSKLLTGKYISGCIGFSVPLVIGMLVSIIILSRTIPQVLTGEVIVSAALFFATVSLFLSAVVLLGLFVSSLGPRSPVVLLLLFSFWVGMMITPNLSHLIANRVVDVMRDSDVARESVRINEEYSVNVIFKRIKDNEFSSIGEVQEAGDRILAERKRLLDNLRDNRENSLRRRASLARKLALISPMSVVQYSGEAVAGTGYEVYRWFIGTLEERMTVFGQYFKEKTGFDTVDFDFAGSNNVTFNGETIRIGKEIPRVKMDFADSPVMETPAYSLRECLALVLRYLMILLAWNVVLAMGALLMFSRADIR